MNKLISLKHNDFFIFTLWLCVFISVIVLTLIIGATPFTEAWEGILLRFTDISTHWNPILDDRIPRLIVLLVSGASLAVAGATMQALFRTPLATPSILGTTAGGSLFIAPIILMDLQLYHPYFLPLTAVLGSFSALFLVYGLSKYRGELSTNSVLLTGLAISGLLLSIEGALQYAFRTHWQQIQLLSELNAGSTLNISWQQVNMQLPLAIVGLIGCLYYSWDLDILSLGDEEALSLGVEVRKVRYRIFLCISLLIGGTLAAIGNIAFFGLLIPCTLRAIFGPSNRRLIPLCIAWGAVGLCFFDLMMRYFELQLFSLGHLSTLLGSLLFLWLLIKR